MRSLDPASKGRLEVPNMGAFGCGVTSRGCNSASAKGGAVAVNGFHG